LSAAPLIENDGTNQAMNLSVAEIISETPDGLREHQSVDPIAFGVED